MGADSDEGKLGCELIFFRRIEGRSGRASEKDVQGVFPPMPFSMPSGNLKTFLSVHELYTSAAISSSGKALEWKNRM